MLPCVCRIQEIPPCPATNNRIKNFTKYEGELNMKKQFVKALVLILAPVPVPPVIRIRRYHGGRNH